MQNSEFFTQILCKMVNYIHFNHIHIIIFIQPKQHSNYPKKCGEYFCKNWSSDSTKTNYKYSCMHVNLKFPENKWEVAENKLEVAVETGSTIISQAVERNTQTKT